MYFFDPQNPNKYQTIKNYLIPYTTNLTKFRYGGSGDSSYVYLKELMDKTEIIYSYGIGSDPHGLIFDIACANEDKQMFMYDASITYLPVPIHPNFNFRSEYVTKDNFQRHVTENGHLKKTDMVLKMDIESYEFDVVIENIEFINKHFNQISIEIHSLIEEIPHGWVIDEVTADIKKNEEKKILFLSLLNKYYNIFHIHANNHSPRYGDLPDCLEISYVRKDSAELTGVETQEYPILGFDFPNYDGREDYKLNWWTEK